MNKQVEQIRTEIVRLRNEHEKAVRACSGLNTIAMTHGGAQKVCDEILNFIDYQTEEQPNEDLETEIATWIQSHLEIKNKQFEICREPMTKWAEAIARHFYELGQASVPMPEDTVLFQKGVAEGRRLEKDDVMKDLPKWKKNAGALRYTILEDEHGRYIQHDGYKLYFDDLLKLPKEDEQ